MPALAGHLAEKFNWLVSRQKIKWNKWIFIWFYMSNKGSSTKSSNIYVTKFCIWFVFNSYKTRQKNFLLLLPLSTITIDQFIEKTDNNDSNGNMSISKHSKFWEPKSSPYWILFLSRPKNLKILGRWFGLQKSWNVLRSKNGHYYHRLGDSDGSSCLLLYAEKTLAHVELLVNAW